MHTLIQASTKYLEGPDGWAQRPGGAVAEVWRSREFKQSLYGTGLSSLLHTTPTAKVGDRIAVTLGRMAAAMIAHGWVMRAGRRKGLLSSIPLTHHTNHSKVGAAFRFQPRITDSSSRVVGGLSWRLVLRPRRRAGVVRRPAERPPSMAVAEHGRWRTG